MSKLRTNSMLVSLSLSMFSPKKTDKKVTKEVLDQHRATESSGKFVKTILPEVALESLKKLQSEIREYHYENTLPWSVEGAAILSSTSYLPYVDKMRGFNRKWDELVEAFLDKYDDYKQSARTSLRDLFDIEDYPTQDRVRKKFKFKTEFLPFPDSSDFRLDLADGEMEELREQMEGKLKEATDNARKELWRRLATPLKTMADRLGDPKAKVYETLVTNLTDIVGLIPALNVTGDPELEKLRNMIEQDITRWRHDESSTKAFTETLRKSPSTRFETAQKANAILATMADYLPSDGSAPAAAPMELPSEPAPEPEPEPVPILDLPIFAPPALELVPAARSNNWRSRFAHSR